MLGWSVHSGIPARSRFTEFCEAQTAFLLKYPVSIETVFISALKKIRYVLFTPSLFKGSTLIWPWDSEILIQFHDTPFVPEGAMGRESLSKLYYRATEKPRKLLGQMLHEGGSRSMIRKLNWRDPDRDSVLFQCTRQKIPTYKQYDENAKYWVRLCCNLLSNCRWINSISSPHAFFLLGF